jgi:hypothetical protein
LGPKNRYQQKLVFPTQQEGTNNSACWFPAGFLLVRFPAGSLLVSCWFSAWFPMDFLLACWFIAGFCLASCWFPAGVWLLPWSGQIGKLASSFLDMPSRLKTGVEQLGLPGAGVNLLLLFCCVLFRFFSVQANRLTLCGSMCPWVHMLPRRVQPGQMSVCLAVCCAGAVKLCFSYLLCKSKYLFSTRVS